MRLWFLNCNSLPCDSGIQYKYRTCQVPKFRGVNDCQGSTQKDQACNTHACPSEKNKKRPLQIRIFYPPSYLLGIKAIFWKTNDEWYADMADYDDAKGIQLYIQNRMYTRLEVGIWWDTISYLGMTFFRKRLVQPRSMVRVLDQTHQWPQWPWLGQRHGRPLPRASQGYVGPMLELSRSLFRRHRSVHIVF